MWKQVKIGVRNTFLYDVINGIRGKKALCEWKKSGKRGPPPHIVKQRVVKEYAYRFGIRVFVETGTYLGAMVEATKKTFRRIYSIEVDEQLYERAKSRFRKYDHITILHGDSAVVLPIILRNVHEPALFWLDGHYSGGITGMGENETPILNELKCILDHSVKNHIILIDDARCFIGENDYPTMKELYSVFARYPNWVIEVKDDIILCIATG